MHKAIKSQQSNRSNMQQTTIEFQQDQIHIEPKRVNKYGNLIILFEGQRLLLSIGPHYYLFIPTLIGFIIAAILLTNFVNHIFTNLIFRTINVSFSIIQIASYLTVALSNPGIVFPAQENIKFKNEQERALSQIVDQSSLCDKCGARKAKRVRHCSYCNICIKGYDHHCPWVSKCIGSQNYEYFNFFVGRIYAKQEQLPYIQCTIQLYYAYAQRLDIMYDQKLQKSKQSIRRVQQIIRHFYYSFAPQGNVIPYLSFFDEYYDNPLNKCMIYPTKCSPIRFSASATSWTFEAVKG